MHHLGAELSPTEQETLDWMILGLTNIEIANIRAVSEETVKTTVKHILWKLDARNRVYAVSIAWETGLVDSNTLREMRERFQRLPRVSNAASNRRRVKR